MTRRRVASRVLVVCRHHVLAARLRRQFANEPDIELEFVEPSEYAVRATQGPASDVIVLDVSATAPGGYDVYRVLQSRSAAPPLLVLRATATRAHGLRGPRWNSSSGMEALEARLHQALGRVTDRRAWLPIRHDGAHLQASLPGTIVTVDGLEVTLSSREADLLAVLLAHVNRTVTREVLIEEIWGFETRALDVYVRRLRRKLGAAGAQIATVTGFGYRFVEPTATDTRAPHSGPRQDVGVVTNH